MPSSFKTEKLELNFWANIDRPVRSDFNRDNTILDSTVGGHIEDNTLHLTENDRNKLRDTYAIRVLQGTDESTREITLGFSPSIVIYYATNKPPAFYADGVNKVYFAVSAQETFGSAGIEIVNERVIITHTTTGDIRYDLNSSSCQYVLIAIR